MLDSVELFQELGVRFALHQRHFLKRCFSSVIIQFNFISRKI
jgi:hypothetical protein